MRRIYLAVLMSGLFLSPTLYAQDTDPAPVEPEQAPVAVEPTAEEPVKEVPVTVEAATEAAPAASATVVVEADEDASDEEKKPWSVSLGVSHSADSGNFVTTAEDYNNSFGHIGQRWSFGAGYGFEVLGQKLRAGLGFGTSVTLSNPQSSHGRRVSPSDTSLSLRAGSLYKDELTGINLSARLGMSLPTSHASLNGRKKYAGFSGGLGLSREFGGLSVSYGFGIGHTLYASKVAADYTPIVSELNSNNCVAAGDDVFRCFAGFANPYLGLSNSLSLGYSITDELSVSYNVGVRNTFKYAVAEDGDEFTLPESSQNPGSDTGTGSSETVESDLSVSYAVSEGLSSVLDLPFSLSATLGVGVQHSAQRRDDNGQTVTYLPLIYNSYGPQAANGYGAVYLSLNGSY